MNNNHPNRNWRARMHAQCAERLARLDCLGRLGTLSEDQLREVMAQCYRAGYEDGRRPQRPKQQSNET